VRYPDQTEAAIISPQESFHPKTFRCQNFAKYTEV